MIKKLISQISIELKNKHFYLFLLLGIIIFLTIIISYFIKYPNASAKEAFSLLSVASIATALLFTIIFLLKYGFWNSISKSYKESKTSVGSYREERKMLKMTEAERRVYRKDLKRRNEERLKKPRMSNWVFHFNSFIFGSLFILFIIIYIAL
ncbi:hypothetical protein [Mycoplasmopsis edwardii]|uniref:Uncharacterized protein n=1 Tax=Mycoplasmopsis edwardii TaxID=53558 RepID=A0ACD4PH13_9BACT|nr:hypothetical protein [Mycoplasmopsis edwardii]WBP83877.1 hypothetical protein Me_995_000503 [Mycoplasmopsis edwardii]